MQRSAYPNPAPAHSPPLHHPVPQHVSTVPQLRSPPPPMSQSQSQNGYGYGGQQQQQGGAGFNVHPAFGGFMNDSTAQMGFQLGKSAVNAGSEYVEQNLGRFAISPSALKHYFNVTNSYVVNKLFLVLFPFRHRPWSRKQTQEGSYLPPREDINSPDMYIPVMAFVTYVLLSTLLAGFRGQFQPELLGYTATTAFGLVIFEILVLKLACYLLSITNESQLLDLVAYSGYKFVGIIVTTIAGEVGTGGAGTGGWVGWTVFGYTWFALAFFLLRSMKYVLMPESNTGAMQTSRSQKATRTYFLFLYSFAWQIIPMWVLSKQ